MIHSVRKFVSEIYHILCLFNVIQVNVDMDALSRKILIVWSMLFLFFQLIDVFGQRSNVSLVFEFMETDLEVSRTIRRKTVVILCKDCQKLLKM